MPQESNQKKESFNLHTFDPDTASQADYLRALYEQNKKIRKHLGFMVLSGYLRLLFIYIPFVITLILAYIYLPDIIKTFIAQYTQFMGAGSSGSINIEDIMSALSPEQLGGIQQFLQSGR